MELKQVFATPDGRQFDTKKEAMEYLRRPKILEALNKLTEDNEQLSQWLLDNQESVESAFEVGIIRRVSKAEYGRLRKALDYIGEKLAGDPKAAFVIDHLDEIYGSFKWPTVKKLSDEEKAAACRHALISATNGNANVAEWIISNKDELLQAYQAGIEKRQVSQKAQEALAAYRAKMAAQKAAQPSQ